MWKGLGTRLGAYGLLADATRKYMCTYVSQRQACLNRIEAKAYTFKTAGRVKHQDAPDGVCTCEVICDMKIQFHVQCAHIVCT